MTAPQTPARPDSPIPPGRAGTAAPVPSVSPFSAEVLTDAAKALRACARYLGVEFDANDTLSLAAAVLRAPVLQADMDGMLDERLRWVGMLARVYLVLDAADAGEFATAGRDFGRGVAEVTRRIRDALAGPCPVCGAPGQGRRPGEAAHCLPNVEGGYDQRTEVPR